MQNMQCLYNKNHKIKATKYKDHLYKCYKNLKEDYLKHKIDFKPEKPIQCKKETIFYFESEKESHLKNCKYCKKYNKEYINEKNNKNDESLNIKISNNNKKNFLDENISIFNYESTIINPQKTLTKNELKTNEEELNNSSELNIFFDIL
jgi:hypothetical protein